MKNKTIGYSIEIDCGKYPNWIAFRVDKAKAEAVKREMLQYGYSESEITITRKEVK